MALMEQQYTKYTGSERLSHTGFMRRTRPEAPHWVATTMHPLVIYYNWSNSWLICMVARCVPKYNSAQCQKDVYDVYVSA